MSESQERMCAVVSPDKLESFLSICTKWDVTATVIGEVDDTRRLTVEWHGQKIVDVPPRTVAHDGPVYERPYARPSWQDALQADTGDELARPQTGKELRDTVLQLAGSPNLASKSWVTDQYDRYVLGNTVLAQPADAGVVRVDEETGRGVAVATDGNGRYCKLDPYAGALLALSEAYRNVAVTGAKPLAVTDCLNFGSPEDPDVMWQFAETTRALADGCLEMGVPVTGGNVSFYNQTGHVAIHPTPVVGVLGVIDAVTRRTPMTPADGHALFVLGETRDELGGSEWANVVHNHLGGLPPRPDLAAEMRLADLLVAGSEQGVLGAAHDVSDGGLAQCLVEMCLAGKRGVRVSLPEGDDPFVGLFSESVARVVVAVDPTYVAAVRQLAAEHDVPLASIGEVVGDAFEVTGLFSLPVAQLRATSEATLPALFA